MRRGRLHRWAELLASGIGLLAAASPALGQGSIRIPEGCGSEVEFRNEIERLTGAPAAAAMPSSLRIDAVARSAAGADAAGGEGAGGEGAGSGAGYEMRLVLRDEVRVLRDPQCRILFRSAIVIAAAAARSEPAASSPPAPQPAPPPVTSAAPPGDPASPTKGSGPPASASGRVTTAPSDAAAAARGAARVRQSPAARPAKRPLRRRRALAPRTRPAGPVVSPARSEPGAAARTPIVSPALGELHGGLAFGVGVSAGVLPDLGAVLEVGGRLEVLPWGLDVSFRYWPQRSQSREGRTVDVASAGARVAALFRIVSALNLLAGLELNRLVGEGAEGVSDRDADAVWQLAPTLGFSLITWDIGSLRLEAGVAGRLSIARPRFLVEGFGDVYRVPLLGADAIIRGVGLF